eukprot:CAMPEP_0116023144 /NCGR_PEP_ID=MMETSP0321-20121206/11413_1 /TAXON_ID=163516 /ORGANISM="Leptocylindrus danicus var. danicus, Strain B650" /LENGTH=215 /DNA_ID=CAMNT_0003494361 /DNA_START=147 /DNA_END=790 /DNA_ORIENTATION=-
MQKGGMKLGGPNLGTLIMVFHDVLERENFSLPPFAGKWATGSVNNRIRQMSGHPRIPLIGADAAKEILKKVQFCDSHLGIKCTFSYLRRGTAKMATAQTYGAASRTIDNQVFFAPPFAACDERVTDKMIYNWHDQSYKNLKRFGLASLIKGHSSRCACFVVCVHNEGNQSPGFCEQCEQDAIERLDAIARGSVVLSIEEELSQRGQAAIFRDRRG